MFDKVKFANTLKKISDTYENQRDFSKKSGINRTYLSQYINMKLDKPPKPDILKKLSVASQGSTTYDELMQICGYHRIEVITPQLYSPYVTETEWNLLFGKYQRIELTEIEQIAFQKMQDKINNPQTFNEKYNSINFDYSDYINDTCSKREKDVILRLYFYFLLLLSKFLGDKKLHSEILTYVMKKLDPLEIQPYTEDSTFYMCPVYGKIAAGIPNWAEECLESYLPIDPNLMGIINPEECFFLKVNGESMNKVIQNGAYALIRKQDIVENGEIAAVLVNGFEATLKKFTMQGDLVILEPMSENSNFTIQVYGKDTEIKILGKYIGKFEINK